MTARRFPPPFLSEIAPSGTHTAGQAEISIYSAREVAGIKGLTIVGPLPAEINLRDCLWRGGHHRRAAPNAASTFVKCRRRCFCNKKLQTRKGPPQNTALALSGERYPTLERAIVGETGLFLRFRFQIRGVAIGGPMLFQPGPNAKLAFVFFNPACGGGASAENAV
jgi:hypothetical protein